MFTCRECVTVVWCEESETSANVLTYENEREKTQTQQQQQTGDMINEFEPNERQICFSFHFNPFDLVRFNYVVLIQRRKKLSGIEYV